MLLLALLLATAMGGCAATRGGADALDAEDAAENNDPLEGLNRQIFAVNLTIDTFVLRPAAVAYRELMPEPGKTVVRNFINNLKLPFTAINSLAQGDSERAETAIGRFLVNTVLGIGGLFDPATELGLPYHKEDFGQTLAVWGLEDGPYLVLPLIGPSNFRDAIGTGVGWVADPVKIATDAADLEEVMTGVMAGDAVDARYRNLGPIDSLRERSLDFYATVRSLYRQRRLNEIRNGATDPVEDATVLSQQPLPLLPADAAGRPHEARSGGAGSPQADPAQPLVETAAALPEPDQPAGASPSGAVEPARGTVHSSYSEALRAFQAAARAYERAVRSVSDESRSTMIPEDE